MLLTNEKYRILSIKSCDPLREIQGWNSAVWIWIVTNIFAVGRIVNYSPRTDSQLPPPIKFSQICNLLKLNCLGWWTNPVTFFCVNGRSHGFFLLSMMALLNMWVLLPIYSYPSRVHLFSNFSSHSTSKKKKYIRWHSIVPAKFSSLTPTL